MSRAVLPHPEGLPNFRTPAAIVSSPSTVCPRPRSRSRTRPRPRHRHRWRPLTSLAEPSTPNPKLPGGLPEVPQTLSAVQEVSQKYHLEVFQVDSLISLHYLIALVSMCAAPCENYGCFSLASYLLTQIVKRISQIIASLIGFVTAVNSIAD